MRSGQLVIEVETKEDFLRCIEKNFEPRAKSEFRVKSKVTILSSFEAHDHPSNSHLSVLD